MVCYKRGLPRLVYSDDQLLITLLVEHPGYTRYLNIFVTKLIVENPSKKFTARMQGTVSNFKEMFIEIPGNEISPICE